MSRHFARASSERLVYTVGMPSWPYGTVAAAFRKTILLGAGSFATVVGTDAAADDAAGFFCDGDNGDRFSLYNGTGAAVTGGTGMGLTATEGWVICACTKTTGTTTPRFHRFRWSAGDWVHGNAAATTPDPALTVTGIKIGVNHTNGDAFEGDLLAVMMAPKYVMSDSEIERLPEGRWERWVDTVSPGFLVEFKSGRDTPVLGAERDDSRTRIAASSIVGTSRGAVADPTGFQFSRLTRRR